MEVSPYIENTPNRTRKDFYAQRAEAETHLVFCHDKTGCYWAEVAHPYPMHEAVQDVINLEYPDCVAIYRIEDGKRVDASEEIARKALDRLITSHDALDQDLPQLITLHCKDALAQVEELRAEVEADSRMLSAAGSYA